MVRINGELPPYCGDNLYIHQGATLSPIIATIFHKDLKKIWNLSGSVTEDMNCHSMPAPWPDFLCFLCSCCMVSSVKRSVNSSTSCSKNVFSPCQWRCLQLEQLYLSSSTDFHSRILDVFLPIACFISLSSDVFPLFSEKEVTDLIQKKIYKQWGTLSLILASLFFLCFRYIFFIIRFLIRWPPPILVVTLCRSGCILIHLYYLPAFLITFPSSSSFHPQ